MRYKRYYGRKRKPSTNVIRMKFQSFMDISTSDQSMQIITISAGGKEIVKRLGAQFQAYKYFKIGSISAKLVPASTLPVDPTGLSYVAGDPGVDPRDQLTPGMMRITNGEDIFEDISGLSDDVQHAIYNNMLLDPRWFKWMLQSGTSRRAYPRYWQIGQLHQDKWPGATVNYPRITDTSVVGTVFGRISEKDDVGRVVDDTRGSSPYGFFQVGHKGVLGWLPTDGLQPVVTANETTTDFPFIAAPPEVEVMKIILPKAYKTKYYYRLFITEEVLFREPIVNFGIPFDFGGQVGLATVRPLDVFHNAIQPYPMMPTQVSSYDGGEQEQRTGGNYGNY